jgi:NAD(P)-dependent dehydrogenase (short-subunit alcohol dehydrogenase family)
MTTAALAGERVLVTGAGSSVGRAMAEHFVAAGARVHICDVDAAAVAATLGANPSIRGTVGSVGKPQDVERIFAEARSWLEDVSVLVNTVGVGGPHAAVEDVTLEDWQKTMAANVDGMFLCIRQAVPAMKRHGHGAIINFSSASTRTGLPMRTPYVVSKYAVEGLTRNLARELGPFGIRVNAILPGMIDNDRMRGIIQRNAAAQGKTAAQLEAEYLKFISMRSKISLEELSSMVVYLASFPARHVTGQLLGVDGNSEWES